MLFLRDCVICEYGLLKYEDEVSFSFLSGCWWLVMEWIEWEVSSAVAKN